jgi:DUF1365 family protein
VWHAREHPSYQFTHDVWYLGLDLAEVDEVERSLRLFGHNRLRAASVYDRDYELLNAGSLESHDSHAAELITMPRFLGYAFNPVSFLLHRDATGAVQDVQAEVHNTWGERHVYSLPRENPRGYESSAAKVFYVSPFMDVRGGYRFELDQGADGSLRIRIDESDGHERFFSAGIDVKPLPLNDRNLARLLVGCPLLNLKTIAMIHWHGLRIWRRGEPFRPHARRARQVDNAGEQ